MCSEILTVRDGLCIEGARGDVRQLFLAVFARKLAARDQAEIQMVG